MAFPDDRPGSYDPDKGYNESSASWTTDDAIILKSGGKSKEVLIAIGHEQLYFGED